MLLYSDTRSEINDTYFGWKAIFMIPLFSKTSTKRWKKKKIGFDTVHETKMKVVYSINLFYRGFVL